MDLDSSPFSIKEGFYTYMLNGILNTVDGYLFSISNAPSNKNTFNIPTGFYITGSIPTNKIGEFFVTICNPTTNQSRIGLIDINLNTYIEYINNSNIDLNFKLSKQVEGEYKETLNCKKYIYITDNFNSMRYLDVTAPYGFGDVIDQDDINIFPNYYDGTPVCITTTSVGEEGILLSGVYQFEIQYADVSGNPITAPMALTGPISIYRSPTNSGWLSVEGSAPGTPSTKSINLLISNLNPNLDYYNIIVIETINGVTDQYSVVTLPVTENTYNFAGYEIKKPLTSQQALKVDKFYRTAKTVTATNNYLLWGNLKGGNTPNLQKLVTENIALQWKDYGIYYSDLKEDYKNPVSSAYRKSFMRDEVYAFGISFTLLDGQETAVFHIPARRQNLTSLNLPINNGNPTSDSYGSLPTYSFNEWDNKIINNNDTIDPVTGNIDPKERWKVYNTATINNPTPVVENSIGCKRYGEFSYFETENTYPAIKDCTGQYVYPRELDINGVPTGNMAAIRHHKFPDCNISPIYDITYTESELNFFSDNLFNFSGGSFSGDVFNSFKALYGGIQNFPIPTVINLLGIELLQESLDNFFTALNLEIDNYPDLNNNSIIGYNLYVSDRAIDKTIIAKGQIFNSRLYTPDDGIKLHFQNYPFNPLVGRTYGSAGAMLRDLTYKLDFDISGVTSDNASVDTFDFWSPSTTFNRTSLQTTKIKIEQSNFGQGLTEMKPANRHVTVINNTDDEKDYNPALILVGRGDYNSRTVLGSNYIGSINYNLKDCLYINANFKGEINNNFAFGIDNTLSPEIVHLRTSRNVIDPTTIEGLSTFYYSKELKFDGADPGDYPYTYYDSDSSTVISAQYVSLKNDNASPYADLSNIKYNKIDENCKLNPCNIIFGGDTFITNYSFKKNHNYFTEYVNDWPINYSTTQNYIAPLTTPIINSNGRLQGALGSRYYFQPSGAILGNGRETFLLASNTASTFFCESEVNSELRYTEDADYTKFYPNYNYLTATNLPITIYPDWYSQYNSFLYNQDYSKNFDNKPYYILNNLQLEDCSFCDNIFENRVIYSQKSSQEELVDDWLIYPAGNFYDFSKKAGEIWSLKAIGQDRLFTRCTKSAFIQLANQTLQATAATIELKSVELFDPEPRELITVDGGFLGTKSQWCYNNTPSGSYYVDTLNTEIFSFDGQTPKSLSANKISLWCNNNLSLRILEDYPDFPNIDNPANPFTGVGYTSVWDQANQLWYITKKDYKLKKVKNSGGNIVIPEYSAKDDTFYIGPLNNKTKVNFKDTTYFSDQSFTLSYSPLTNSFISFYSFTPNGYLYNKNKFNSYIDNRLFEHNIRGSFTNYYNTQSEHIIEYVSKLDTLVSTKRSVQWRTQSFSFSNDNNTPYENQFDTYYKAIVYNNEQITGVLNLIPPTTSGTNNLLNLSNINNYPTINSNSVNVQIQQTTNDRVWKLSELWDRCGNRTTNNPLFTNNYTNPDFISQYPIDKVINQNAVNYNKDWFNIMRMDNYCKVRLFYNQEDKQLINIIALSKDKIINS